MVTYFDLCFLAHNKHFIRNYCLYQQNTDELAIAKLDQITHCPFLNVFCLIIERQVDTDGLFYSDRSVR